MRINANSGKQLGLRIRSLRRRKHMSQRELAAAVGVHVNTVARWELTGIDPHHPLIPAIKAAFTAAGRAEAEASEAMREE